MGKTGGICCLELLWLVLLMFCEEDGKKVPVISDFVSKGGKLTVEPHEAETSRDGGHIWFENGRLHGSEKQEIRHVVLSGL